MKGRSKFIGTLTILTFAGVFALWLITPFVVKAMYPDLTQRGQFGDLFGSINALFSGLAFAGVIIAILLQREELELQRRELVANRQELGRAATAQEESREALRKTIYANGFRTAIDLLQVPSVQDARKHVFQVLRNLEMKKWNEHDRECAQAVCNTYDFVGRMVKTDLVPTNYVIEAWGDSIRQSWPILEPFVLDYRIERGAPEYWIGYQHLAKQASEHQTANNTP